MAHYSSPNSANRSAPSSQASAPVRMPVDDIRFGKPLDPRLFSDIAQEKARQVANAANSLNKPSQLRRFYDELLLWHDKIGSDDAKFLELQPYVYMLKAKVAYAKGRNHIDDNFELLIRQILDQAISAETLRQAKLFLEAFMAFYKVYRKDA
jgi:CRISPR-associated protein Csm2